MRIGTCEWLPDGRPRVLFGSSARFASAAAALEPSFWSPRCTHRRYGSEVRASRPWLVMVTGEPGSGKTSLGTQLAAALRVPFLSRDHVRGGLLATAGLWTNQLHDPPPRKAAIDTLVEIVEATARSGVTSVLEFVVTPQRRDALRRLRGAADCLVILATCHDAAARAERRDRADPLLRRPEVLAALGHQSIDQYLSAPEREVVRATMQSEFDLPLLKVATDDGYDPHLDQVVDWIIDQTRR